MARDSEKVYESLDRLSNDIRDILDIILKELARKRKHLEYLEKRIDEENNNNLQLKKVLDYYNVSSNDNKK
ncbi:putative CopG family antitoxin [Clostridium pascui]|uniref:hypothetical protein n=1 Tax=Clostridium pascui TaxID=46609 RepID=UPI00195DA226|nr:hypothetical protein [Clostridium pascui]MBM7869493.1 putative CopG family antitoxin [Clostridium pascui]